MIWYLPMYVAAGMRMTTTRIREEHIIDIVLNIQEIMYRNLKQYCTRSSVKYTGDHVQEPKQYCTRSSVKYTGDHVQEPKQYCTRSSIKYTGDHVQEP